MGIHRVGAPSGYLKSFVLSFLLFLFFFFSFLLFVFLFSLSLGSPLAPGPLDMLPSRYAPEWEKSIPMKLIFRNFQHFYPIQDLGSLCDSDLLAELKSSNSIALHATACALCHVNRNSSTYRSFVRIKVLQIWGGEQGKGES